MAPEFLNPLSDVVCAFGETVVLCCKVCARPKPSITLKGPDQNPVTSSSRFTVDIRYTHTPLWVFLFVCFLLIFFSSFLPRDSSPLLFRRDTGDILLKICNVMPQDTGIYTCVAVNDHGSASSSASIKVQGLPPFTVGKVVISAFFITADAEAALLVLQVSQQPLGGLWRRRPAPRQ